jgi:hypothetical protein
VLLEEGALEISEQTEIRFSLRFRVQRHLQLLNTDRMTAPLLPAGAVAGWALHPLESAAFSRRTPFADTGEDK